MGNLTGINPDAAVGLLTEFFAPSPSSSLPPIEGAIFPAGRVVGGLFFSIVKGLRRHGRSLFRSSKKVCTCVYVKSVQARKG